LLFFGCSLFFLVKETLWRPEENGLHIHFKESVTERMSILIYKLRLPKEVTKFFEDGGGIAGLV